MKKSFRKLRKMAPRKSEHPEKDFTVRWTDADKTANLPTRFAKALDTTCRERASTIRSMIRCFTEIVEKKSFDALIPEVARKTVESPPKKKK